MSLSIDKSSTFWWLLAAMTVWRVTLAFQLDIIFDEGHYFYWALYPQLSYFDHPPMTAWAIASARLVFGDSVLAVRFWPLLAGTLVPIIGRDFARRAFSEPVANRAGVFLTLCPLFVGVGLLMTPDTPLLLFWALTIWATWRALEDSNGWWWVAGLAAGLGALSKYTMALYFLGLAVLALRLPEKRNNILVGATIAGLVTLLVFLPVIAWNLQTDFISFRYQLDHGLGVESDDSVLSTFPEYIGSLLLVGTPVLGAWILFESVKSLRAEDTARRFSAVFFGCVVLVFAVAALRSRGEANWSMPAFFTGFMLVAQAWSRGRRWLRTSSLVVLAGLTVIVLGYLSVPRDPGLTIAGKSLDVERLEEAYGGREFADAVRQAFRETGAAFIASDREVIIGELAFYAPELRPVLVITGERAIRLPWVDQGAWRGKDALVVTGGAPAATWFGTLEPIGVRSIPIRGQLQRQITLSHGFDYRPPLR